MKRYKFEVRITQLEDTTMNDRFAEIEGPVVGSTREVTLQELNDFEGGPAKLAEFLLFGLAAEVLQGLSGQSFKGNGVEHVDG